jgi:ubiquinone/menaquinone biosynthesis C-methylase UbiE
MQSIVTVPVTVTIATGITLAVCAYFLALLVRDQAVFIPLSNKTIDEMLKMADARPDDVLFDLGSGDGRVVIAAAKKYGTKAVGIEKSKILAWLSRRVIRKNGVQDRVRIVNADFFGQDLSQATIVTAYLSRRINCKLESKLRDELKEGTRILSADHTFNFPERAKVKTGHFWTHLYVK